MANLSTCLLCFFKFFYFILLAPRSCLDCPQNEAMQTASCETCKKNNNNNFSGCFKHRVISVHEGRREHYRVNFFFFLLRQGFSRPLGQRTRRKIAKICYMASNRYVSMKVDWINSFSTAKAERKASEKRGRGGALGLSLFKATWVNTKESLLSILSWHVLSILADGALTGSSEGCWLTLFSRKRRLLWFKVFFSPNRDAH